MDAIQVGDRVWAQFIDVSSSQCRAWVYPLTVVMLTEDGELVCLDEQLKKTRVFTETFETVSTSESQAWRACEAALQRVAGDCLTKASECATRAKGVRCAV
jgi:hypothetical protein